MLQVKIVPVTAFQQNCSIVWDSDSKEAILIDAGGEPEKLKAEIEALGLTVKALWLTHAHLESPNFKLHFNRDGFAPSSYERITDTQQQEHSDLGYNVDWQTADSVHPEQQPTRQPRQVADNGSNKNSQATPRASSQQQNTTSHSNDHRSNANTNASNATTRAPQLQTQSRTQSQNAPTVATTAAPVASQNNNATAAQPQAVVWLSNLFA